MPVQEMQAVVSPGAEGKRYSFDGYDIIFKSPNESATEAWTAIDYTMPAHREGPPLHYLRDLIESFYVISGQVWMRVGDEEVNAGPGSYVWVPAGMPHTFANRSDAPAHFLGHASGPRHKDFLCELLDLAIAEKAWPPADPKRIIELGARYDTYYLVG